MDRNPTFFESYYKKFMRNQKEWLPEGIVDVDLKLLHQLDLLKYHSPQRPKLSLTRYFNVIESNEKITLINEQFVIWIVPDKIDNFPATYIYIALNSMEGIQLETAFATWGIYNSSKLVLKVLEKMLYDIQETEDLLSVLKKASPQSS